jgi:uncharacterized protein
MLNAKQIELIRGTLSKYKPLYVGVFGSYARNEQNTQSDLDILVDFETPVNLLDVIGIEQELSEALDVKVDLITQRSVNKRLQAYIDKDLIQIA